jgi:peptidoglycan/xylan/chitin deacetylase (PgdA/CDA1 family)
MLSLFKKYNVNVTWGTVAMASFESKKELLSFSPVTRPNYLNKNIDPYYHLNNVGKNENEDPYHFGYSLLEQILDVEGMEVASHTFSHFYCLEKHDDGAFEADLKAASASFNRLGVDPKSIIFCRNQYSDKHLQVAKDAGFNAYRGNERHYLYHPRQKHPLSVRAIRLLDTYINISGHHLAIPRETINGLVNIPSSRFMRPVSNFSYVESLRLNRIKTSMLSAAKEGYGFHLWWHPHNFGNNVNQNLYFLTDILEYYRFLYDRYGMLSLNMSEVQKKLAGR